MVFTFGLARSHNLGSAEKMARVSFWGYEEVMTRKISLDFLHLMTRLPYLVFY